jgi:hypothetical protein
MKRSRTDTDNNALRRIHLEAATSKGSAGDTEKTRMQRPSSGTVCRVLADVDPIENGSNGEHSKHLRTTHDGQRTPR